MTNKETTALAGLRVVEFAQLIAGPLAGTFLADFGAEVVHVESPGYGDPGRYTGAAKDGVYLWWKVAGRNKRSVTLDLRQAEGQALAHQLVEWADVVITNLRVGTLERWGLDWETLHRVNPKLVVLQVSGFGANTTRRDEPGFGKVGEAMSGVVHITGFPDGPPVHTGFSHGDSVAGLMGAFAVQTALYRRDNDPDFAGEWIDMALFEPLFRLVEWQVVVHDQLGQSPMRAGNRLANAPAAVINMYRSKDDHWVTVTTGTWQSVLKVVALLGLPVEDYDTPAKQYGPGVTDFLDAQLRQYIVERTAEEVLQAMHATGVVASLIYDAEAISTDATYREREAIISVDDPDLGAVRMQAVLPKFENHPGKVWRTGPALGEDNDLVYLDYLGLAPAEYERLRAAGVV